jgi:hypothetical protein
MKWLFPILIIGVCFRFINLNWDQNQHLHPDERFLTMVTENISWPKNILEYFDTAASSLNPHNAGYAFYVYGTFPIFSIKALSQLTHFASYNGITLIGRYTSALLDSLIIILVYIISLRIFKSEKKAIFSSLTYTASVLPIQLAHFYVVDAYVTFFVVLSFYFLIRMVDSVKRRHQVLYSIGLGLVYGLALASKISAVLFLPILFLGFLYPLIKTRKLLPLLVPGLLFSISCFTTLRVLQPYMFTDLFRINPEFISNLKLLKSYENPSGWFPPSVQWIKTIPLVFPLENIFLWGLGPVLGLLSLISLPYSLKVIKQYPKLFLVVIWIVGLFIYQGIQLAKPMRYFYPIYPFIAVIAGPVLSEIWSFLKNKLLKAVFIVLLIYWPLSFISIYTYPHTRVQATDWILKNIPAGSVLSCEYWDDCLPLGYHSPFKTVELHLYDPDNGRQKWQDISDKLARVDYIILSSNRLYGSIMSVPEKYPVTVRYYQDLFSGKLGFIPVAQFSSRPNLPLPGLQLCLTPQFINYGKIASSIQTCNVPGISFVDDYADESLTVYDHPKIIIFARKPVSGI